MRDRMTAGEVCTRSVAIAYRGMVLSEAARLIRERHVGCLVVVEEDDPGRIVAKALRSGRQRESAARP